MQDTKILKYLKYQILHIQNEDYLPNMQRQRDLMC